MNLPFIYKYKPSDLKNFEMNKEIKDIFYSLVNNDNLNLLLVGNGGSGKTTLIEIIINEYYKDSKDKYKENILEINNLKEQGIQYYRNELKIFCQTSSTIIGKKKIIILDDIDNINEQSQQVFRNCIDKYSHNVNFISSCTNIQKVIDTLQSRIIIIKIPPIQNYQMINILQHIIKNENISINEENSNKIIELSNFSIRLLINYLEKIKILNIELNEEVINSICSNISYDIFDRYTNFILQKNIHSSIKILYDLYDNGYSVMDILDNYFVYIKTCKLIDDEIIKYKIIKLICYFITIFHNIHEDEIELSIFTNNYIKLIT
jgi:DNA polymerase III delta prime subunit